jgi:hypothetical protein
VELLGDLLFKVCSGLITTIKSSNLIWFMSQFIPFSLLTSGSSSNIIFKMMIKDMYKK